MGLARKCHEDDKLLLQAPNSFSDVSLIFFPYARSHSSSDVDFPRTRQITIKVERSSSTDSDARFISSEDICVACLYCTDVKE